MRILLVEDDRSILHSVRDKLQADGYQVDTAENGNDADTLGQTAQYEAILLDLGLPDRGGLALLANWRRRGIQTPVVIITARGSWTEKVEGFNAGADDYIAKPFQYEELLARLRAVLRRANLASQGRRLTRGKIDLLEDSRTVVADGKSSELTAHEFKVLRYLMLHAGIVVSKAKLEEQIYEDDQDHESNVLEVYISRLRKKVGEDRIITRRGQGYLFPREGSE
ncbi:MAG TPA: response regulator transcription factor [Leptospiraceae bacterium]|jgi:DNA-binding response OmpR family regulator|nr:response regulator transcription factor [Leptospirales bacterium]HMU81882.1 response regulator transcription factor [Leptospiraceae bacterium]HMW58716.1 response regulator transcription factor [Leptospiraceae bacterium]HMX56111.1 response regulator transcription factor [Leptospiraceae bacterium]HMZ37740.1 response regulator transcription factor [Leptospiraceae bacterium]